MDVTTFLEKCRVNPNEKITANDGSWWRLKDLLEHYTELSGITNEGSEPDIGGVDIHAHFISCRPDRFQDARNLCIRRFGNFNDFRINNGQARYHILEPSPNLKRLFYAYKVIWGNKRTRRDVSLYDTLKLYP